MNLLLPDSVQLVWWLLALVLVAVLVTAAVGVAVRAVARRALDDPARARRLSRAVVGVLAAVFAVALLANLTGTRPGARVLVALPGVVAAVLLVVIGLVVAPVLRGLSHRGLQAIRPGVADIVAPLVYWLVVGLAVLLAADQLGIETGLVKQLLVLLVGAVVLAMALAFGLGARDLVAAVVAGRHVAQIIAVGDQVEVGGRRGTVTSLGHASVRLSIDGGEAEIPNARFLDDAVVVLRRAAAAATTQTAPETRGGG